MKVTVREESPDGTVVESSVTFDKKETQNSEDDESTSHPVAPGPIAVCGLRSLLCFILGGRCCGRERNL